MKSIIQSNKGKRFTGLLKYVTVIPFLFSFCEKNLVHAEIIQCHQVFLNSLVNSNHLFKTSDIITHKNNSVILLKNEKSLPLIEAKSELDVNRINASWEISRLGAGEILSQLHNMDNVLYYSMTALLAQENILIDGPGGGAKTLALRKIYEAQLHAVNKLNKNDIAERFHDSYELQKVFIELVQQDLKITDPAKKIFTQQFHATLSESKILGGPDPFKFISDGQYEIDYKKALIHESNMFAILDELEKAPVALQMTLLSILNERQALVGNKIIQTMLESVAATTNATLGELIAQALPHEVGGRRAMIDRFPIKIHTVNVSTGAMDAFLLIEKVERAKNENKFIVIDLRGLRPLLAQISIPQEVLKAMTDITLQLDRRYTEYLLRSQEEVQGTQLAPSFYPAFSGSTRSQSKVIKLWQSAFLVRQLLKGVPFDQIQLAMKPQDLIDLAPALLQGSPDIIVPKMGVRIPFVQALDREAFTILGSNSKNPQMQKYNLSVGYYDPRTQLFQYVSALTGEVHQVYFDRKNNKFETQNNVIKNEIILDPNDISILTTYERTQKYINLAATLERVHTQLAQNKKYQLKNPFPSYQLTGKMQDLIDKGALREAPKKQLEEIVYFHQEFLDLVNMQIQFLENKSLTPINSLSLTNELGVFKQEAKILKLQIDEALKTKKSELEVSELAARTVKQSFEELSFLFKGASSTIKAIFMSILNQKNLMLFGPPGSAKTMLSRIIFEKELEGISDLQIAKMNTLLVKQLLDAKVTSQSLWIKQFHPMSNEGDIVGRIDLAALKRGEGYTYNRSGTLSAKDVLFSLLDEFEKSPPAVRTSLLSILNERQLLDGDTVIQSGLIAVILATNQTPGEFIIGQGDFSTAFPIIDRIQVKAYSVNKLSASDLEEFHRRKYLKIPLVLQSPLMLHPLIQFTKSFKIKTFEKMLLTQIHQDFMTEAVKKSDAEREMHLADPQMWPDFYMNSRGESARSLISAHTEELPGAILLNRILDGKTITEIQEEGFHFELSDLEYFAQLYLTHNNMYSVKHSYNEQGLLIFRVVDGDLSSIMDRIDSREHKMFEYMKWEAEEMVQTLNKNVSEFLKNQMHAIQQHPELYPTAFASKENRIKWLKNAGFTDQQIQINSDAHSKNTIQSGMDTDLNRSGPLH